MMKTVIATFALALSAGLVPYAESHLSLPMTKLQTYQVSGYTVNITVGTPPQISMAAIDTGSSDTFPCTYENPWGYFNPNKSSTYQHLYSMDPYISQYGQGALQFGPYFADTISLDDVTEANQTMALIPLPDIASSPYKLLGLDFDASELKGQELMLKSNCTSTAIPTYPKFVTTLQDQGSIRKRAYSVYLNAVDAGFGELLFGARDMAKFIAALKYVHMARDPVTHLHDTMMVPWAALALRMANGKTMQLPLPAKSNATFDSGTTFTYFPLPAARQVAEVVQAVERNISGAVHFYLPCNTSTVFSLSYSFRDENTACGLSGGSRVEVPASELVLLVPANLGTNVKGLPVFGSETCELGIMGQEADTPNLGYLLGNTFMCSAYLVFDLEVKKIGIAQAKADVTEREIVEL